jgi:hypothetical protein
LRRSASRSAGPLDASALVLVALAVSATGARGCSEISRLRPSSCVSGRSENPCDRLFHDDRTRRHRPSRRAPRPRAPRARGVPRRPLGLRSAAVLIQTYPEIEAALRRGDLCLSSTIEVAKVITRENAAEVLPRFFGKSARDAAFVAASIRPVENPPVREFLVTPVRGAPVEAAPDVTAGAFRAPEVEFGSAPLPAALAGPSPSSFAAPSSSTAPDRPKVRPLDAERARINMTVSRRLLNKLATARDALSHSHPGASEEAILELGLDLIIDRHRKRRGVGAKPRAKTPPAVAVPVSPESAPSIPAPAPAVPETSAGQSAPPAPVPPPSLPPPLQTRRSRYVTAAVKRAVWARDGGCCAWKLENGGVCGSTFKLEYDHVDGFALGAGNTVDELRLACHFHQVANLRRLYGDAVTDRYVRPRAPRCSEPTAIYAAARDRSRRDPRVRRRRASVARRRALTAPPLRGAPRARGRAASRSTG